MQHRLGIDVGGTHTDAVILDEKNQLIAKTKARTTADVSSGIEQALKQILEQPGVKAESIAHAMLGTTHCTNAITERKHLSTVGVIRLGAPASLSIPPLVLMAGRSAGARGEKNFHPAWRTRVRRQRDRRVPGKGNLARDSPA